MGAKGRKDPAGRAQEPNTWAKGLEEEGVPRKAEIRQIQHAGRARRGIGKNAGPNQCFGEWVWRHEGEQKGDCD